MRTLPRWMSRVRVPSFALDLTASGQKTGQVFLFKLPNGGHSLSKDVEHILTTEKECGIERDTEESV